MRLSLSCCKACLASSCNGNAKPCKVGFLLSTLISVCIQNTHNRKQGLYIYKPLICYINMYLDNWGYLCLSTYGGNSSSLVLNRKVQNFVKIHFIFMYLKTKSITGHSPVPLCPVRCIIKKYICLDINLQADKLSDTQFWYEGIYTFLTFLTSVILIWWSCCSAVVRGAGVEEEDRCRR